MSHKKRYAQVGVGSRGAMYFEAILGEYAEYAELAALCDNNAGRLEVRRQQVAARGVSVPVYLAEDFDRMVQEQGVECVIVTSRDSTHDHFICRAMELGADVITEKPMTIDEERCQRIVATQRRTGRTCTVTFNARYGASSMHVKELLMSGVIGEVLSVDFNWLLNTAHGASYFHRWNAYKQFSGGLLVHKATHHFDLVNWWLSAIPETVFAVGGRRFYTPQTAVRYGLTERNDRCLGCRSSDRCPWYFDVRKGQAGVMYHAQEQFDGYALDHCVFAQDTDIEDSMQLVVTYDTGASMSYSLNAFLPWEGMTIRLNGTRGRLEFSESETFDVRGEGAGSAAPILHEPAIRICPHFREPYSVKARYVKDGHGGGDPLLLGDLFLPEPPADAFMRTSDQRAGAYSILTGIAANRSIETGQAVRIDSLVQDIGRPDFPPMPSADEPLTPAPSRGTI